MNVSAELAELRKHNQTGDRAAYARECCALAKRLEKVSKYDQAREALSDFWPDTSEPPDVESLDRETTGEIMMRAGCIVGWLGSVNQVAHDQEFAKNLLTSSLEIFTEIGNQTKAAEAQSELGLCYWREGAFDEARIHLAQALAQLGSEQSDLKAIVLIRAGIVEVSVRRLNEALRLFTAAAPIVDQTSDHVLKGCFHTEYGLVFRRLAAPENREDYIDRALIEYAAASFHFEQAGNDRLLAAVENNLGVLFSTVGRYNEAHVHLNRARALFCQLRDQGMVGRIDDTRARAFLDEGRVTDAERVIRQSVRTLERGSEQADYAYSLTTYGVTVARLGRYGRARELLERAIEVAQTAGDSDGAGRAKLCIIEELAGQTPPVEMAAEFGQAAELLKESQDPITVRRLIQCALKVIDVLSEVKPTEPDTGEASWEGFSFKREVLKIEKVIIEKALRDAGGSVTKAARLLGFKHHQSLIALINSRHRDLLTSRSAVRKRRQHLFSKPRQIKKKAAGAETGDGTIPDGPAYT